MNRRVSRIASRAMVAAVGAAIAISAPTGTARAQERLVGQRSLGIGATYDVVTFGDNGLLQEAFAGLGAARIKRVEQLTIPVSTTIPLSQRWTFDATALYATGSVTYDGVNGARGQTARLSGISDIRLRATGRIFTDALAITVGVNAPTGKTELDTTSLFALRTLAAPALGLGSTPVGTGPSGTIGLLGLRAIGLWSVAVGASYEYRGTYQPITALIAGAPPTDFSPGGVFRVSLGVDRIIGKNRFDFTTSADVFAEDQLSAPSGTGDGTLARVQLGPLLTTDAQLRLASPRTRDVVLWVSHRWRAAYARDDKTVSGSDGQYVDGGINTAFPVTPSLDITTALDGRWHSGLAVDEGLPTAGVKSGMITLGLSQRAGTFTLQPYARAQVGRVQARGAARDSQNASITGASFGLVVVSRF